MPIFLYHFRPENMKGTVLYPLNHLKEVYPDAFERQVEKYVGRERLLDQMVPLLNCLWNDVLHLTAVRPSLVHDAMIRAGRKKMINISIFRIDPAILEPENTIVYLYRHENVLEQWDETNFKWFDMADLPQYTSLPDRTKEYYREEIAAGRRPLFFHRVPHILYKGTIETASVPEVGWDE